MNTIDDSEHYERLPAGQNPSLLTIILDTNPGPWSLLSEVLTFSNAVASLLVLINAHLACNYTNKIALIASHCTTAKWLYPSPVEQHAPRTERKKRGPDDDFASSNDPLSEPTKKLKINGPVHSTLNGIKLKLKSKNSENVRSSSESNKYRPFRLVEEELIRNLTNLLNSTDPSTISNSTSTMIAGALTLALSYINRETIAYSESIGGSSTLEDPTSMRNPASTEANPTNTLQSRILLLSVSPSTDLAHQYIPIMNAIFACQRRSIPIDICQIPLPDTASSSTVFLQQASDATKGIYIPLQSPGGLLQYLLMAFLPSQSSRTHLILPTRIDVDFRAACFCHRRIVDIGFVCSICLSIFCSVPENGDCLTCGTHLQLGDYGGRPLVVARKKKKKNRATLEGSGVSTPTPGPAG